MNKNVDDFQISDMNFGQLNVWAGAIHHCRCTTEWIQQLVDRGASVQGSCGQAQLIKCTKVTGN